jgi:hypothetical protein
MPLDDREQRILAEIERQFYEEDPDLAHAVKNIDRSAKFGIRLPVLGVVIGAAVVILTFSFSTLLGLAGFLLLVVSATALVHGIRSRGRTSSGGPLPGSEARARLRRRFRRS